MIDVRDQVVIVSLGFTKTLSRMSANGDRGNKSNLDPSMETLFDHLYSSLQTISLYKKQANARTHALCGLDARNTNLGSLNQMLYIHVPSSRPFYNPQYTLL